jgi:MFS family permease
VLHVDAAHLQYLMLIIMVPWSVKPILGLLSDLTVVGGYHKRAWLLLALAMGTSATLVAVLCRAVGVAGPFAFALCFMGIQFQIALYDLLSESTYSAIMRDHPETGSDIVTAVQAYQHAGGTIAMLFVGVLADHGQYYALFGILAALCAAPLVPTVLGWLPEERVEWPLATSAAGRAQYGSHSCLARTRNFVSRNFFLVNRNQLTRDAGMIAIIAFTGIAAPVTAVVANLMDPALGLSVALLFTIAALLGAFFVFPPMIARIALYQVLTTLASPRLGSAMDYFYTADAQCLPGGPHFSYVFYQTYAGLVGAIMTLFAVVLYVVVLGKLRFRTVLVVTTVLAGAVGASDLFIVTRTNVKMGISDQAAYMGKIRR